MDTNSTTPIACHACAKAKAKCDKKIPCTRCSNKRQTCNPRNARRPGDVSSSKPARQPDVSTSRGPATPRLDTTSDSLPQKRSAPSSSTSSNYGPLTTPFALNSVSAADGSQMLNQSFDFSTSQGQLLNSIQSPSDSRPPLAPMQGFADMEGILEGNFNLDGCAKLLPDGMQDMADFSLPLAPDPLFYMDDSQDMLFPTDLSQFSPSDKMMPDFNRFGGLPPSINPLEIESPSDSTSLNSRSSSRGAFSEMSTSQCSIQEHKAVVVARDGWSCFKCNPPADPSACPKTARIHLEGLEQTLKNRDAWTQRDLVPELSKSEAKQPNIQIGTLSSFTREKLLAVTQSFLHKALEIHYSNLPNRQNMSFTESTGFIVLPPPTILEHFLKAYVYRFEPYYPSVSACSLNPNDLMQAGNARVSSLLLLLMIAHGASATPTVEARSLTSGLTEACRISLFDVIDKDIELIQNLNVLRCGLLFTTVAVWGGDKWHMDIAMGQRGMYISMLSRAGLLDFRDTRLSLQQCQTDPERAWESWKSYEARSRLVASWVLVDQEISLFMDVPPMLSITNLNTSMPDMDALWEARTSSDWLEAYEHASGTLYKPRMTLYDLFRFFMDGELMSPNVQLSPLQLRLLLHPLISLANHLRQFLSCYSGGTSNRKGSRPMTQMATRTRLEEVQSLLKQWYDLAGRCSGNWTDGSTTTCANLILYHHCYLNTIISVPEIERLARSEIGPDPFRSSSWLEVACTEDAEEIFFHCGQILRLVRSMPESVRPPWWPASVYRVALTSWMTSMANLKARCLLSSLGRDSNQPFAIDNLTLEHPALMRYLKTGEGRPMLSKRDGTLVSLEVPQEILTYCVDMLNDELTTSFKDGIRSKLAKLAERWKIWKF